MKMFRHDNDVDKGLKKGQEWPSKPHKSLAQNVALYNVKVHTVAQMREIVQKVLIIPRSELTFSYRDLVRKYDIPHVHG